jgi:hypothetical protein
MQDRADHPVHPRAVVAPQALCYAATAAPATAALTCPSLKRKRRAIHPSPTLQALTETEQAGGGNNSGIRLDTAQETCDGWIETAISTRTTAHEGWPSRGGRNAAPTGRRALVSREGFASMLHVTCDACGRQLRPAEDRYVVKIEVFATHDPAELTEADLDEDHLEAVAELIRQIEAGEEPDALEPTTHSLRYDLCAECRTRYVRDPLSKEAAQKFDFSEN